VGTTTKTLYDTDFVEWTAHTAEMLREGRLGDAVVSHLSRLLLHQIKRKIQPERDGAS
jgi:hypothetical protein